MKRVIVFFDYSNFHGALNQATNGEFPDRKRFDFNRFVQALTRNMDLIKVYFVCSAGVGSGAVGLQRFYDWLDGQEYFYVKQFERRGNGPAGEQREKQVDVYLATQVVALAYENAYDIAIIVSGDEDYIPAIEIVQQKGKVVIVVSSAALLSDALRKKADRVLLIDSEGEYHAVNFLA